MTGKRYYLTTLAAWQRQTPRCAQSHFIVLDSNPVAADAQILVLVTADESAHIALEDNPEVEALPHPLARSPISERAAEALASIGVVPGDDTFTMTEKLARVHPLLKYRVF